MAPPMPSTVRELMTCTFVLFCYFFFNDTATTEIYTLSLHDALPISAPGPARSAPPRASRPHRRPPRSEEHTSELQSRENIVCRLLLEKKKNEDDEQLLVERKELPPTLAVAQSRG